MTAATPAQRYRFPEAAVRRFDRLLRRSSGVHEYSGDADCIFRIAFRTAPKDVTLPDGTLVRSGDPIAELHLWNEHVPQVHRTGADIAWGVSVDKCARRSFRLLAHYLAAYPSIVAVHAEAALGCQMGHEQSVRLAKRYGFEILDAGVTLRSRARHWCDDFLFWALTRTFNPHSLKRKRLHRRRHNIWMSRAELNKRWKGARVP